MNHLPVFNILLVIHFVTFLGYTAILVLLFPKQDRRLDKKGLVLGIILLLTGICLAVLKYPAINYYKIVPKVFIFFVISVISAVYNSKALPKPIYYLLLSLTLLASLIAVVKT